MKIKISKNEWQWIWIATLTFSYLLFMVISYLNNNLNRRRFGDLQKALNAHIQLYHPPPVENILPLWDGQNYYESGYRPQEKEAK